MKKLLFYPKLAITNIKNNSKNYLPFIITCIATVLMFYNMAALTYNNTTGSGSLGMLMSMSAVVTAIFCVIFIFYTNSFLIKRRKKEFGLFNILGMEKKHIGKIMFWENTIVATTSILLGLLFGILFSKMVTLLLYKILQFDPVYKFEININAIIRTLILFSIIFILTLISSLVQVGKSKTIELLQGGAVGEKEPKSNWLITIIGVITLGIGYGIALTVKNPYSVFALFLVAVIAVIIGTYCLFTSGSVVLLKALRKNKSYYYKTKHFVSLSSMIYRMKKNAVGLANICIMSTAVLVMISTTVSMYIGMNDLMKHRFPNDVLISETYTPQTRPKNKSTENNLKEILAEDNISYKNFFSYEFMIFYSSINENSYKIDNQSNSKEFNNSSMLLFIYVDNVADFIGEDIKLSDNEVVLASNREVDSIIAFDDEFKVVKKINNDNDKIRLNKFKQLGIDVAYVLVNSPQVIDKLYNNQNSSVKINNNISFDFDKSDEEIIEYCNNTFTSKIKQINNGCISCDIKQLNIADFYGLYGGLFFIGIFLGFLFLLATVLIIYYKQVVEGFEDKERFRIMQNVGMSKQEVKKSIGSQVFTVFALPLIGAIIHIIVAFPILTIMLSLLNLDNIKLFGICTALTVLVFCIIYTIVYFMTSKVYYKIVNGK